MTNKEYVKEVFEMLHEMPELGFQEYKTSEFIAKELEKMGYEVTRKVGSDTGVIGVLDSGNPGLILGLRADIDALEYENEGVKYCYHACGHDAHSAMALGAAKIAAEKGIKRGKLYMVFQPAEELGSGAISMVESGALDEIQEMIGIHLRPKQETVMGLASPALTHGAGYRVDVKVEGQFAHGARPHLGVNAINAGALIINSINTLAFDPTVPHSIKATKFNAGGTSYNIIPDKAEVTFDMRAQNNVVIDAMVNAVKETVVNSAKSIGAKAEVVSIKGVPAADYDEGLVEEVRESIVNVLGSSLGPMITVGGEDFHYFSKMMKIKTAYIGLGCDLTPGLHDPEMTFNRDALIDGQNIFVDIVEKKLG